MLLFSITFLSAQEYRLGYMAGIGLSHITSAWPEEYPQTVSYKPYFSTSINAYVGLKGKGNFGAFIEPGFIIKGGVLKNDPNGNTNVKVSLTYLHLPLSLQYSLNDKLFISAGPEVSLLFRAREKSGGVSHDATIYLDNELELSGQVALNYSLTERVDIGMRYGKGFSFVRDITIVDANYNPVGNVKAYNQYLHFLIRVKSRKAYKNAGEK